MARTLPTKAPKRRLPPRELVEAFTLKSPQATLRPGEQARRAAAGIKATAQAAQKISREQGISFEAAGGVLRQTLRDLKRTRAAFRGFASGRAKRGVTDPITSDVAIRRLVGSPNTLRGVEGRSELVRFVVEEEVRRPTTDLRVFRTKVERSRRLLGIRR
jgi:hypothetical protein